MLTAAIPSQQAIEEKGHGIFTSLLAEALTGAASDLLGQVTPGAIYHYVDQALGSWEQRPIFKTNVTSWTPLRTVPPGPGSPAIPRETLRKIVNYFPDPEQEFKLAPDYEFTDPDHDNAKVAIFKDLQAFAAVRPGDSRWRRTHVLGRHEFQILQAHALWKTLLAAGET